MQLSLDINPPRQLAVGGGLEGAERTSRETFRWDAPIISPDRQINPLKDYADARSRDSVQNDGYAMGAVHTHRDSIVGAQYRLNAQPEYTVLGTDEGWADEFQEAVEGRFNLIADSHEAWLDASRKMNLTELIRLAVGGFLMTGEVLATVEWIRQRGRPFSTAIQMISPSRLSNPDGLSDDKLLRRGVRKNVFGEAIGYHIQLAHPTDYYLDPTALQWRYVEARKPWGRRQVLAALAAGLVADRALLFVDFLALGQQLVLAPAAVDDRIDERGFHCVHTRIGAFRIGEGAGCEGEGVVRPGDQDHLTVAHRAGRLAEHIPVGGERPITDAAMLVQRVGFAVSDPFDGVGVGAGVGVGVGLGVGEGVGVGVGIGARVVGADMRVDQQAALQRLLLGAMVIDDDDIDTHHHGTQNF